MLDVVPEAVAAVMPHCCGGAERLQKKRGHLEVDLFFFFLFLLHFFIRAITDKTPGEKPPNQLPVANTPGNGR